MSKEITLAACIEYVRKCSMIAASAVQSGYHVPHSQNNRLPCTTIRSITYLRNSIYMHAWYGCVCMMEPHATLE